MPHRLQRSRSLRLTPLAACLASLLGIADAPATPASPSGAIVVTNCADSGAGSLRAAVASAGPGDAIDLTQLPCSQITLTSGRVTTTQDLLLQGPGPDLLTIDGNNYDRIFDQDTSGAQLAIYGMTLQRGYGFLSGGCVYSKGPVLLNHTVITGCNVFGFAGTSIYQGGGLYVKGLLFASSSKIVDNEVYSSLGGAIGGGAVVTGDAILVNSTISGNRADSSAAAPIVRSGGIDIGGQLTLQYSTVADNSLAGIAANTGTVGGIRVIGPALIQNSTISGNTAGSVGGLGVYGLNSTTTSSISSSTISGNTAAGSIGGAYVHGTIAISNSTIAFNSETYSLGAGLRLSYGIADIESSIIASNGGDVPPVNIGVGIGGGVSGSNNLIGESGSTTLPPDTIQSDPRLLPLSDNGGLTLTHELGSGSPAINAGNNNASLEYDQRGTGFLRVLGAAADIGAVEADVDIIFADGFD
jgi:hypothetical protein